MSENSFNANQFDAVTEFPSHLAFMEELLDRYDLDEDTMKKLRDEIEKLRRKHDDNLLNLSVIGEFSTGKSTFINALLRRDGFLESSSLQGTTTTATIIENSDKYILVCTNKDGSSTEEEFPDCEALEARLADVCADKIKANQLYSVTIKLPAPFLEKRGFRIIDTPGINSNDSWCDDITIRALSELSDLSIIIIDATKALPQQFCEFINANLQSILNQCVFVVTKVNMIRKKELEGVMQYIKEKAEKEFEIKNPLILPYSSTDVLDSIDELDSAELPELVADSIQSEKRIMDHMSSQKSIVQTLNLVALADKIYDKINLYMQSANERHAKALALARRKENLGSEFNEFLREQQEIISHEIDEKFSSWKDEFDKIIDTGMGNLRNGLIVRIGQLQTTNDLYSFFVNGLPETLNSSIRQIIVSINRRDKELFADSAMFCDKFVENFREQFKDVEIFDDEEDLKYSYCPPNDFICFPMLNPIIFYALQFTEFKDLEGNLIPKPTKIDAVQRGFQNINSVLNKYCMDVTAICQNECHNFIEREKHFILNANQRFINNFQKKALEGISDKRDRIEEQMRSIQEDTAQLNVRKGKLDMVSKMLTIMTRGELN